MMSLATDNSFGEYVILAFDENFDAGHGERDQPTPINPFFYLRGDWFWYHHPRPGQDSVLRALSAPPGIKAFQGISECSFLDDELFALLLDPAARSQLGSVLTNRYFCRPEREDHCVCQAAKSEIAKYQRRLDEGGRIAEDASKKLNINN